MRRKALAGIVSVCLCASLVIGSYDRAYGTEVVIGGTISEFILSLLASAGVTCFAADTLANGWENHDTEYYADLFEQMGREYEAERLRVIEGGGGDSDPDPEEPPEWDAFANAAMTAREIKYTPVIWDCVKYAVNEVLKSRVDVENGISGATYTDGYAYLINADGTDRDGWYLTIKRGYISNPSNLNVGLQQEYASILASKAASGSVVISTDNAFYCCADNSPLPQFVKIFSFLSVSHISVQSYSNTEDGPVRNKFIYYAYSPSYGKIMKYSQSGFGEYTYSFSLDNKHTTLVIPPDIPLTFNEFFRLSGFGDLSPKSIIHGSDASWKTPGKLDTLPTPPETVEFPTRQQIDALIEALNNATNNHPDDEEKQEEEQEVAVDNFTNAITNSDPDPDPKPDPDPDPDPDPKPDPDPDPDPTPTPDPGDQKPPDLDSADLQVDIKDFFPFCIPFDLIDFLSVLDAEPETPVIHFPIPTVDPEHEITNNDMVIDLSALDSLMEIVRTGELLLFIVGLLLVTGRVIKW